LDAFALSFGLLSALVLVLVLGLLFILRSNELCNIVDITDGGLFAFESFFNASTSGVCVVVLSSSKQSFAEISSSSPLWNKSSFN